MREEASHDGSAARPHRRPRTGLRGTGARAGRSGRSIRRRDPASAERTHPSRAAGGRGAARGGTDPARPTRARPRGPGTTAASSHSTAVRTCRSTSASGSATPALDWTFPPMAALDWILHFGSRKHVEVGRPRIVGRQGEPVCTHTGLECRGQSLSATGRVSRTSLSDGTLRFIVLATLLLQPVPLRPSVILLDEPELGLHPYAITMLASLVKQASVETQIVFAT